MHAADRSPPSRPPDRIDRDCFAALFESAYGQLWLVAAGILGDRTGADDIVQESALVAWSKRDQFELGSNFVAWLSRFVRWHALNYVRKQAGRNTHARDPHDMDLAQSEPSVESTRLEDDQAGRLPAHQPHFDDQLSRALLSINELARACLLLRTVHHLSYREIAEMLEIPQGTAMSHVHRARQLLRERLEGQEADQSPRGPENA
jgi:RNA polymerase sigma-70 factor (ECF subfamily)